MAKKQKRNKLPVLSVLPLILLISFFYWRLTIRVPNLPEPPLKTLAKAHNLELGIHPKLNRLDDKVYPNIIKSQFSLLTMDGEADMSIIEPSNGKFDFSKADKVLKFAQANNMAVQAHHLFWGEQNRLPAWIKNGHYSKQQLLGIAHTYVTAVVSHYKGKVKEWSVANEVFSRAEHLYGLNDWWADNLSNDPKYLDDYFRWAHLADPSAKLLFNDSNNEVEGNVSDAQFNYIKAAKARGVPIDGLGMQLHINAANPPSKAEVIKNMQRFAAIGAPVYVTEFDVNINTSKGSDAYKSQLEAQITHDMVRACIESKACVSFTEFGVSDKQNWLKKIAGTDSHSYLFDSRYRPKSSFYSLRSALEQI